jgi:ferric-dicitrate binding protein FerR (iron transport regulator)
MRMRQSLAEIESAFYEEMDLERQLAEAQRRQAQTRTRRRHVERQQRHGTVRFVLLVLALLATAVGVTIAMFQTLYLVMG